MGRDASQDRLKTLGVRRQSEAATALLIKQLAG
jgi:hypothetical protein